MMRVQQRRSSPSSSSRKRDSEGSTSDNNSSNCNNAMSSNPSSTILNGLSGSMNGDTLLHVDGGSSNLSSTAVNVDLSPRSTSAVSTTRRRKRRAQQQVARILFLSPQSSALRKFLCYVIVALLFFTFLANCLSVIINNTMSMGYSSNSHGIQQQLQQQQQILNKASSSRLRLYHPAARSRTLSSLDEQQQQAQSIFDVNPPFRHFSDAALTCDKLTKDDQISFTLVTQCSDDRLWMMQHHCLRWSYSASSSETQNQKTLNRFISLAVYTNKTLEKVREQLDSFNCPGPDRLALQVFPSTNDDDYPVNFLRNQALAQVQTTHVVYVDVDFWPSIDLFDNLHSPQVVQTLKASHQNALVLPAFQLKRQCLNDCREANIERMPLLKDDLIEALVNHSATAFDPTNFGGHGSTRYQEWIELQDDDYVYYSASASADVNAASSSDQKKRQERQVLQQTKKQHIKVLPIECVKSNRYEPYLVFRYCRNLPPFQEVFTGYGKNKMTWVMHLRRLGYQFSQLGGSFLCHYPHLDSKSRLAWNGGPDGMRIAKPTLLRDNDNNNNEGQTTDTHDSVLLNYKRGRNDHAFVEFRKWLVTSVPDQTKVGMCEDAKDDDEKLWVDPREVEALRRLEEKEQRNKQAQRQDTKRQL